MKPGKRKLVRPTKFTYKQYRRQHWTKMEKKQLIGALHVHSIYDLDAVEKFIPTRTKEEIEWFLNKRATMASVRDIQYHGMELDSNIEGWLKCMGHILKDDVDYSFTLSKVMAIAGNLEPHYPKKHHVDPDFSLIYRYLSAIMCGAEPPILHSWDATVLLDLLQGLAADLKTLDLEEQVRVMQEKVLQLQWDCINKGSNPTSSNEQSSSSGPSATVSVPPDDISLQEPGPSGSYEPAVAATSNSLPSSTTSSTLSMVPNGIANTQTPILSFQNQTNYLPPCTLSSLPDMPSASSSMISNLPSSGFTSVIQKSSLQPITDNTPPLSNTPSSMAASSSTSGNLHSLSPFTLCNLATVSKPPSNIGASNSVGITPNLPFSLTLPNAIPSIQPISSLAAPSASYYETSQSQTSSSTTSTIQNSTVSSQVQQPSIQESKVSWSLDPLASSHEPVNSIALSEPSISVLNSPSEEVSPPVASNSEDTTSLEPMHVDTGSQPATVPLHHTEPMQIDNGMQSSTDPLSSAVLIPQSGTSSSQLNPIKPQTIEFNPPDPDNELNFSIISLPDGTVLLKEISKEEANKHASEVISITTSEVANATPPELRMISVPQAPDSNSVSSENETAQQLSLTKVSSENESGQTGKDANTICSVGTYDSNIAEVSNMTKQNLSGVLLPSGSSLQANLASTGTGTCETICVDTPSNLATASIPPVEGTTQPNIPLIVNNSANIDPSQARFQDPPMVERVVIAQQEFGGDNPNVSVSNSKGLLINPLQSSGSPVLPVNTGVPQGSVIGPSPFKTFPLSPMVERLTSPAVSSGNGGTEIVPGVNVTSANNINICPPILPTMQSTSQLPAIGQNASGYINQNKQICNFTVTNPASSQNISVAGSSVKGKRPVGRPRKRRAPAPDSASSNTRGTTPGPPEGLPQNRQAKENNTPSQTQSKKKPNMMFSLNPFNVPIHLLNPKVKQAKETNDVNSSQ